MTKTKAKTFSMWEMYDALQRLCLELVLIIDDIAWTVGKRRGKEERFYISIEIE